MKKVRALFASEDGLMTWWFSALIFVLLLISGVAIDFGAQVNAEQRADAVAAQAARAACEAVDAASAIRGEGVGVNAGAAVVAGNNFLKAAQVQGSITVVGTECRARVSMTFRPMMLRLMGFTRLPVNGAATAHMYRTLEGGR